MIRAGVPVVPGSDGLIRDLKTAKRTALEVGSAIMLKATAGGGGKGMRIVNTEEEIEAALEAAQKEAKASFGNDGMYIEKFVEEPRHVEIQIAGDQYGAVCHLSERECSIQRRHQKLLEESPSPFIDDEVRKKTVTEEVIDYDLIREQIKIAAGEPISGINYFPTMHAIECRINAEDVYNGFRPSPGKITSFHSPKGHGVRVDTHVYAGYTIPPYYDSMIAKLICRARTREECIAKVKRSLNEFVVEGVKTTIPFHQQLMDDPNFISGNFTTKFLETFELKKP